MRLILILALIPAAYALLVLAHPLVRCPGCLGKRVVHSRPKPGKRPKVSKCPLCDARGIYRMPGATVVHGFFWAVLGDRLRDRQHQAAAERTDQAGKEPQP